MGMRTRTPAQMFQEALKESPAGSWAPRKHAVVNNGAKVFMNMQ
jgi:hypothetical protein